MDGHGRSENNHHNIDVGKLTKEAEAGHGHYVGSILDQMSFEEQIRIAHQIAICSTEHSKLAGFPKVDVCVRAASGDEQSAQGYSNLQVYRETSNRFWYIPQGGVNLRKFLKSNYR